MRIVVIGSGIIGTTTAYYLAREGHEVEVLETREASGLEASYANGGQLSYAYAEPFGPPAALRHLPHYLRKEGSVFLRFAPEMALWEWYLRLLVQCLPSYTRRNTEAMLRLNLYSRD